MFQNVIDTTKLQYVIGVSCVFSYLQLEVTWQGLYYYSSFYSEETEFIEIKKFRVIQLIS